MMGLKGNCVQEYESGVTCCEGGSELGLRQSRKAFGLICGNLPKSVPGVLTEVR